MRIEEVLKKTKSNYMTSILRQRRMRWLGHVYRMDDGRLPKDILFGQLAIGTRSKGRPMLRYKDVCKTDLKSCNLDPEKLHALTSDRNKWRVAIRKGNSFAEETWRQKKNNKKQCTTGTNSPFSCHTCGRPCQSRIGLYSHEKHCKSKP